MNNDRNAPALLESRGQSEFLSAREAASYLGISLSTMYKISSSRLIVHYKPGGKKLYFLISDLEAWIRSARLASSKEVDRTADSLLGRRSHRCP